MHRILLLIRYHAHFHSHSFHSRLQPLLPHPTHFLSILTPFSIPYLSYILFVYSLAAYSMPLTLLPYYILFHPSFIITYSTILTPSSEHLCVTNNQTHDTFESPTRSRSIHTHSYQSIHYTLYHTAWFTSTNTHYTRIQHSIQLRRHHGVSQQRLHDSRHRDHTTHDRTQSRVELQQTRPILLLPHPNRSDLVLEVHARRSAPEQTRTLHQLTVLRHTVFVTKSTRSMKRNLFHGNQLQEVCHVIEAYTQSHTIPSLAFMFFS